MQWIEELALDRLYINIPSFGGNELYASQNYFWKGARSYFFTPRTFRARKIWTKTGWFKSGKRAWWSSAFICGGSGNNTEMGLGRWGRRFFFALYLQRVLLWEISSIYLYRSCCSSRWRPHQRFRPRRDELDRASELPARLTLRCDIFGPIKYIRSALQVSLVVPASSLKVFFRPGLGLSRLSFILCWCWFLVIYLSPFRSLLLFILLGVFLAYSSLRAGSNERTRTTLGAHQREFWLQ